jgi:hypothetical protein
LINRFIFSQVNLDSGSLTVLASVVHRFSEKGLYFCKIKRGEKEVGSFKILVEEKPTCQTSLKIDLKAMAIEVPVPPNEVACKCLSLVVGGYAVFYVSSGVGGYSLEMTMTGAESGRKVFDSQKLTADDMFVATLLRPGTYRIINAFNETKAELRVIYPEVGKTQQNSQPIKLECNEKEISPAKVCVNPGQGTVFSLKGPSRIKIEIVSPTDCPKPVSVRIQAAQSKDSLEVSRAKKAVRQLKINLSQRS